MACSINILVSDDDEMCRQLLRDMFVADPNVTLTITRDGAEGWWKLTEAGAHFDLGIFDLRMPLVDGLQLIERIRTTAPFRNMPVILCTGINDRETVIHAARLAITHYVVKPYKPANMLEKINSIGARL